MINLSDFNDTLQSYKDGTGRLWDFVPTHDMLVIELTDNSDDELNDDDDERCVYLILVDCAEICLPTRWTLTNPSVKADGSAGFIFTDEGVRVKFRHECQFNEVSPRSSARMAEQGDP